MMSVKLCKARNMLPPYSNFTLVLLLMKNISENAMIGMSFINFSNSALGDKPVHAF